MSAKNVIEMPSFGLYSSLPLVMFTSQAEDTWCLFSFTSYDSRNKFFDLKWSHIVANV